MRTPEQISKIQSLKNQFYTVKDDSIGMFRKVVLLELSQMNVHLCNVCGEWYDKEERGICFCGRDVKVNGSIDLTGEK